MVQILRHELRQEGTQTVLFLYLDRNQTEFARELGNITPESKEDLNKSVNNYIQTKLPNLKNATVKVMVGGMLLTSFAFSPAVTGMFKGNDNRAYAAELGHQGFLDIQANRESAPAIQSLMEKGIIKGYPGGIFQPREEVSRQHAAVMFVRALNLDTENVADPGFKDVPKTHQYYKEIAAATAAGLFNKAENFNPTGKFTRGQSASVIVRAYGLTGDKSTPFTDLQGSGHEEAIGIMYNLGLTKGTSGSTFNPNDNVKREQFAMLMHRTIEATPEVKQDFVQAQDFAYWADAGDGTPAINVGFKLDIEKLSYNNIKEIKVALVDKDGKTVATRTATGAQIEKLKADDETYGGLDGQLSAAFIQRGEAATNDWWSSTAYDFSTPTKAVITITANDNKVYSVENNTPTGIPAAPVTEVQPQDFAYWADAGTGRPAYNVGFKLDVAKLPYDKIKEIKVALVDKDGKTVATRTAATAAQIQQLKSDDETYGGLDGQLSAAFIQRDEAATNEWWTSTAYDFSTPTKAVITITDNDNKVYTVENNNPTGIPTGAVASPENFVQPQDFGYMADAGAGSPGYNVGFKLDVAKLPYNMVKEIKVALVDKDGNTLGTRTATGAQIEKLKADDETYGGLDGQLSAAFVQRNEAASNEWWTSTAYNFTKPAKAVITITDKDNKVYTVENNNPTGIPAGQ